MSNNTSLISITVLSLSLIASQGNAQGICNSALCQSSKPSDISIAVASPLWTDQHTEWLANFTPTYTLRTAPDTFDLLVHDGTHRLFKRLTTIAALDAAPTWITRYRATFAQVVIYKTLKPGEGAHYLVLVPRENNQTLAHWYAPDGERTTFGPNGKFPAFVQSLGQQYRSAEAGDVNGTAATSPKTAYTYLAPTTGMLQSVRDEQGRLTSYEWDAPTRRILSVTQTGPGGQGRVKRTDIQYVQLWKYWYVSEIAERAPDGLGSEALRRTRYSYSEYSKPEYLDYDVRLSGQSREVLGSGGDANAAQWLSTFYTTDKTGQVTGIRHVAGLSPAGPRTEPDTVISYTTSPLFGGLLKTTTQGEGSARRERLQHFERSGLLRREDVWSFNPAASGDAASGVFLIREYGYDESGNQTSLTEPSGKRVASTYDDQGRLSRQDVYVGTALIRSNKFEYDAFNVRAAVVQPEQSGEGYQYPEVRTARSISTLNSVTKDDLTFSLPATVEETQSVGGMVGVRTVETYDTRQRLRSSVRTAGAQTRSSTFSYGDGQAASFALVLPGGQVDETQVRTAVQPDDRITAQTVAGMETGSTYDAAGHLAVEVVKNGLVTAYAGGQPVLRDRRLLRGVDGWGTLASEASFTGAADTPKIEAVKVWRSFSTGEPQSSWEGSPDNVTAYAYGGGADTGRLMKVTRGVGLDTARSEARTVRSGQTSTYDAFGRQDSTLSATGVKTTTAYDTLDRPVKELRADGLSVTTAYSPSGTPQSVSQTDGSATMTSLRQVDALGQITREAVTAGTLGYTLSRTFDPQGRVLKLSDSRLDMNRPGDDQARYVVYDALGHVVKQLGAALSTNTTTFDDRRPYTESSYDALGRKTEDRTLLAGVFSPAQLTPDPGSNLTGMTVARTTYAYDAADHLITQTDPAGFTTSKSYDGVGNLVEERKDVTKPGDAAAVTRYGYDGAGRQILRVNAAGEASQLALNTLGLPVAETDALGNTRRVMTYTADGLLTGVAQPKPGLLSAQALTGAVNGALPAGYVWTQRLSYGTGQTGPVKECVAVMGTAADAQTNCTSLRYDARGHPLETTLPDGSKISRSYDARGQLTREVGSDGRITTLAYDALGRLSSKATAPTAADRAAGLTDGWTVQSGRGLSGRITAQTTNGVATRQTFNSLGLVTSSSRPALVGTPDVPTSLRAYRLDGQLSLEAGFAYSGGLRGPNARFVADGTTRPEVKEGALTVYGRSPRGDLLQASVLGQGGALMTANYQVNGLGLPTRRDFVGDAALYRAPQGTGATYATLWQYDKAGRLTSQWDEVGGQKLNPQSLSYTRAGDIAGVTQDLRVLGGGQILARSEGTTTAQYDARGDLLSTRVETAGANQLTRFDRFLDGQLAAARVEGGGSVAFSKYDALGRPTELKVQGAVKGPVTAQATAAPAQALLTTSYSLDGSVTRQLLQGGTCLYAQTHQVGLGGLGYSTQEWNKTCAGTPANQTTMAYSKTGLATGVTTVVSGAKTTTTNLTRRFDALLNPTTTTQSVVSGDAKAQIQQSIGTFSQGGRLQAQAVQGGAQTSYTLDALGRTVALSAPGSAMDGWRQYFDADGRVTALESPQDKGGARTLIQYRYDLGAQAALSSEASLGTGRITARAYDLQGLPGQPQRLSLQSGGSTLTRDVTFTLLEGVFGERWEEIAPLGTAGTLSSLSLPTPLSSAQFGVQPGEVRPEGGALSVKPVLAPLPGTMRAFSGGLGALQLPESSLPSEQFGLRPGEVSRDAASAAMEAPGVASGKLSAPALGTAAPTGPSASLLDELRRLQRQQRGPFNSGDAP